MTKDAKQNIENILKDLYSIDPAFLTHEKELKTLITRVLAYKPETSFDESFAARLRSELVIRHTDPIHTSKPVLSPFAMLRSSFNMYSGVAGAIIAIIIIAPLSYFTAEHVQNENPASQGQISIKNITSSLPLTPQISDKGKDAFGKIEVPATVPTPASDSTVAPLSINQTATTNVSYTYAGDPLTLSEATGTILKRVKSVSLDSQLISALKGANIGLFNMSSFNFSSVSLHTIDIAESNADGYSATINFDEGVVSLQAKQATTATGTIPDSQTLISLAYNFMQAHSIDSSIYGQPIVKPGTSTVVFPLVLKGVEVYDEQGNQYGLEIVINPQNRKVISVNNLTFQQYESSSYALETDSDKIIKSLSSTNAVSSTTLGTPKQVLMRYISKDGSSELFVPALLFPTTQASSTTKNVIVPLAKVGENPTN